MTIKPRKKQTVGHGYFAKLTSKYQATIPKEIRKSLHIGSGDEILYELLTDGTVIVRKASPLDVDYLKALNSTLNEWGSEEDAQAYKNI